MSTFRRTLPAVACGLLCSLGSACPAEPDERRVADEAVLGAAGVGHDGPALLQFFRTRTLRADDLLEVGALIKQLGDDAFSVREKATERLIRLGPAAGPALRQASRDPDPE